MFRLFEQRHHPFRLTVTVSLGLALWANAPLWARLWQVPEVTGLQGWIFTLSLMVSIAAAIHALLCVFNWPGLLKPVVIALLLVAAPTAHFMASYGIVVDPTMMVNILQTNVRETRDLLNLKFWGSVVALGVLPAVLVLALPLQPLPWRRRTLLNLLALLASLLMAVGSVALTFKDFSSVMRNDKSLRYMVNPLNNVYALGKVMSQPKDRGTQALQGVGRDARWTPSADTRPFLLFVVVGETVRNGHLSLNGYTRDTTPLLARQEVISQKTVEACGTSTAAALPCMFSHLGREEFNDRKQNFESLVDVLHHAGLAVLWLDNQSGCKGLCERTPFVNTSKPAGQEQHPLCPHGECLDEILLETFESQWARLDPVRRARGTVVFMHQMGSHGPAYYKRSPAPLKRFLPECQFNALQQCSQEEIINAYDNSMAYLDHFLNKAIERLKTHQGPSAMVYVSDHGESLGENGIYLHGLPFSIAPDVQKQVPWLTWLSPSWQQSFGLQVACLQGRTQEPLRHDHFFHSVLGLTSVQTPEYRPELDMYRPCRS